MSRMYGLLLLLAVALAALPAAAAPAPAIQADTAALPPPPPAALDREFLGMSIRDPWYEFNTNPAFPGAPNQAFQDQMGVGLELAGVRWVRLEFHIPYDPNQAEACNADCQWEIAK